MPEIKLKPCPFCGSETAPEIFTLAEIACHDEDEATKFELTHFAVACNYSRGGCGASTGGICETEEEAAERWNKRAVRHGYWIIRGGDMWCSECGYGDVTEFGEPEDYRYCPNCGAEMGATETNFSGKGGADNG